MKTRPSDLITIRVTRAQLSAYHNALGCAIDHVEEARGGHPKVHFLAMLVELSDGALVAIWDHDEVPERNRDPKVVSRAALNRKTIDL